MSSTVTSVVVELKDGRRINITGCAPADVICKLANLGVRPVDIKNTIWTINSPEIERLVAARKT